MKAATALFLAATTPLLVLAKQKQLPCAKDPFADPKADPCNPLDYIASDTLAAFAVAVYLVVGICHLISTWKWGAKWMSAMTIGIFTMSIGLACRFGLHTHPDSKGIYIAEYLFVVLSPCAFIAADYVLLGRLSVHLNASQHLLISPRRITLVFISSDITTFLIQAAGGSVSISANDKKTNQTGSNIFLAGLVLQFLSFAIFTSVYIRFLRRVKKFHPEIWTRDTHVKWYNDCRALAGALLVSCAGILVRSVYRVIELSQGFKGAIATNEGLFFGLDTFPLFIAVFIFVPFWPGRFIQRENKGEAPVPLEVVTSAPQGKADLEKGR